MTTYEILTFAAQLLTGIGLIVLGFFQWRINVRLKKLQDYAAVALVPMEGQSVFKFHNVGKINLYLHKFKVQGTTINLPRARLLSSGTGDAAWFWLPTPASQPAGTEIDLTLYLTDEFGNKWISEHGGQFDNGGSLRVWSYKTYKEKWDAYN